MARRKGRRGAPVHVNLEQPQASEARRSRKSGFFDFDTPYDIRPGLINQAALFKFMAQGAPQRLYHDSTKAGAGFGLQRSAKPRRQVQGEANNIATYLEQSDADAWAQALDEMSTEQPAVKKRKKRAPPVSKANDHHSGGSVNENSCSTTVNTCSPAATPATAGVAPARKRKSYAMDIDIAGLEETQERCKKHAGQRSVTWSQDEGGDVVMCSCADLSHVV